MKDETKPPGIRISQIFTARALFEHTVNAIELAPTTPIGEIKTSINVSIGVNNEETAGFVSVIAESDADSTGLYRFHVEMVLLAEADVDSNLSLREYLRNAGAPTLYPFIRETVANLTGKGRFGAAWIPPFNFTAVSELLAEKEKDRQPKDKEAE